MISGLENQFLVFLRAAVLQRFYCSLCVLLRLLQECALPRLIRAFAAYICNNYQNLKTWLKNNIYHYQWTWNVEIFWMSSFVFYCVLCFSCFHICSLLPCGHLLGKGWPVGSCWWCLLYFCYFSMWYPGSGVVLGCIVSWSFCLSYFILIDRCYAWDNIFPVISLWHHFLAMAITVLIWFVPKLHVVNPPTKQCYI